jgi:protein-disulfide isomerase
MLGYNKCLDKLVNGNYVIDITVYTFSYHGFYATETKNEILKRKVKKSNPKKFKKKSLMWAIIFGVVLVGGSVTAFLTMGKNNTPQSQEDPEQLISTLLQPIVQNASALGTAKSNITLVEFGDYQCQYCARFHRDTKDLIVNNFVKTGTINFLFKDFVINDRPSDKLSTLAAIGSYCAAEQGKYWPYHDEVYRNSKGENTEWVSKNSLTQFAVYAGVTDINKFSTCLDSKKYENLVTTNDNLARSIGLTSTPTFILIADGKPPIKIEGAQPYSVFEGAIRQVLTEIPS